MGPRPMARTAPQRWQLAIAVLLALVCAATTAHGDTPEELFRQGTNALGEGRYEEAIRHLEAYADRAEPHPDASYNRGVAYVMRLRADGGRTGDLGRAAAAFEETILLRADDADATHALELVHAEVARRRARRGKDLMTVRPTLDRVVVGLASERTWGIAAALSSLLLAVGLALWGRRSRAVQISGRIMRPTAALALLLFVPLYFGARHLRQNSRPGVVVVAEVYLTNESGISQGGQPIPEAARVELGEQRGRLLQVRWGSREGWVPYGAVRVLRVP